MLLVVQHRQQLTDNTLLDVLDDGDEAKLLHHRRVNTSKEFERLQLLVDHLQVFVRPLRGPRW